MVDPKTLSFIDLFAEMPPEQLETIAKNMRPLHLGAKDALVTEGVTTRGPLFILLNGTVEVSRKDGQGNSHVLATIEPPTVIGEMEFLADIESSATVVAAEEIEGYLLPRARFEALFAEGDPAAFHLAKAIGRLVSERLADTNKLLTKALAGDTERLMKVQKAQMSPEALAHIDEELDSLLQGI